MFSFYCFGHRNISARHRNTIEFTREPELSAKGDCIVGVRADFDYERLKDFVNQNKARKIECEINAAGLKDVLSFYLNAEFSDREEIVIRKTDFKSPRTLGIKADKAAKDIKRELAEKIRDKNRKIKVIFTGHSHEKEDIKQERDKRHK
ncbi:DUF371 domain-containing protein [Candidatus Woesearchaeota archaeon]|nr:DUF371 domain-containing protein [Candidatus Woesearchaeota archaeon]